MIDNKNAIEIEDRDLLCVSLRPRELEIIFLQCKERRKRKKGWGNALLLNCAVVKRRRGRADQLRVPMVHCLCTVQRDEHFE